MSAPQKYPCPCCGYATLDERGAYDICLVCFWEDDGQDNADAHLVKGGPNDVSLSQARRNYIEFGASEKHLVPDVRPPRPDEPRVRAFAIVEGQVVEISPPPEA